MTSSPVGAAPHGVASPPTATFRPHRVRNELSTKAFNTMNRDVRSGEVRYSAHLAAVGAADEPRFVTNVASSGPLVSPRPGDVGDPDESPCGYRSWRVANESLDLASTELLRASAANWRPHTRNGRFVVVVLGDATHRRRLHPGVDR